MSAKKDAAEEQAEEQTGETTGIEAPTSNDVGEQTLTKADYAEDGEPA